MKILVVDDEETNRLLFEAILQHAGYTVCMAENGVQAVEVFRRESPDIILMDIMMPVMDGYEATRQIKLIAEERFIPVLFLTAMTDENDLAECIESGGDDFLTKPFRRTILLAKIRALERIKNLYSTIQQQNERLDAYHRYLRRDQELVEQLFAKLMKHGEFELPNLHSLHLPAETYSGDIMLVSKQPSGMVYLMVGDFTGHGLAAAVGALPAAQIFYAMCGKGFPLEAIISEINTRLKLLLPANMFLAACLVQIHVAKGLLWIWNGGLPEAILFNGRSRKIIQRFASAHPALGVIGSNELSMRTEQYQFSDDDQLLIYTDGLIETSNAEGEMYGQSRLEQKLADTSHVEDIATAIDRDLLQFRQVATQEDDITLLIYSCDRQMLQKIPVSDQTTINTLPAVSWQFMLELDADALRELEPAPLLSKLVNQIQGLYRHKEDIFLILTELYVNALDYGVLHLDSSLKASASGFDEYYRQRRQRLSSLVQGWIKVQVQNQPCGNGGELRIILSDSGTGFEPEMREIDLSENRQTYGRGLALIKALASEVVIHPPGNCIEVMYRWV